jgi:hypothetical protein
MHRVIVELFIVELCTGKGLSQALEALTGVALVKKLQNGHGRWFIFA